MRKAKEDISKIYEDLLNIAKQTRKNSLMMIQNAGSGNPGSALSCVDILTWLMLCEMHIDKKNPKWEDRDKLILSKGHSAPVFYSICVHLGWIDRNELLGFRLANTRLQTHPDYNTLDCVDFPSGSLGMGLSAANGMALGARYLKKKIPRYFVLIGDGELQEGQVWEAAMTAGHYGLENITVIVDNNKFQQDGKTQNIMNITPMSDKWEAFGWQVAETDGHSFDDLSNTLRSLREAKPKIIIAHTIKGKGVSFMENNNDWHIGGPKFTEEILKKAMTEIDK